MGSIKKEDYCEISAQSFFVLNIPSSKNLNYFFRMHVPFQLHAQDCLAKMHTSKLDMNTQAKY